MICAPAFIASSVCATTLELTRNAVYSRDRKAVRLKVINISLFVQGTALSQHLQDGIPIKGFANVPLATATSRPVK